MPAPGPSVEPLGLSKPGAPVSPAPAPGPPSAPSPSSSSRTAMALSAAQPPPSTPKPSRIDTRPPLTKSIMREPSNTFPMAANPVGPGSKGTIDDIIKAKPVSATAAASSGASATAPSSGPGSTVPPNLTTRIVASRSVSNGGSVPTTGQVHSPSPFHNPSTSKHSLLVKLPPLATNELVSGFTPTSASSGVSSTASSPFPGNESDADLVRRRSVISFTEPPNHERLHRAASMAKQHYQQNQHQQLSGAASAISSSAANYKASHKRISSPSPASSSRHTSPVTSRQGSIVKAGGLGSTEVTPNTALSSFTSENATSITPDLGSPVSPPMVNKGFGQGSITGSNLAFASESNHSMPSSHDISAPVSSSPPAPAVNHESKKLNIKPKLFTFASNVSSSSSLVSSHESEVAYFPPMTVSAPTTTTMPAPVSTKKTSLIITPGSEATDAGVNKNPATSAANTKSINSNTLNSSTFTHSATSALAMSNASDVFSLSSNSSSSSLSNKNVSNKANGSHEKVRILLAVTGSVASIKIGLIIGKLQQVYGVNGVEIQLIITAAAEHFIQHIRNKIPPDVKIWKDENEWATWKGRTDKVLHVELRRWADILLVAPLSANSLAKIANGICDNLLTSVVRCWNPTTPVMVAPAMNTFMYTNPMTKKHLAIIKEEFPWIEVLKPIEKVLVCGDIGMGGMREWSDIVETMVTRLGGPDDDDDDDEDDDDDDEDDEDETGNENEDEDEDEDDGDNEYEDEYEDEDDNDENQNHINNNNDINDNKNENGDKIHDNDDDNEDLEIVHPETPLETKRGLIRPT
ncbi:hypothetical protein NADFUDRAFT_81714 [Nadsonia fulvescens var. elongata DSM 6958]|uniref:Flavoprotein domain-containing protein n=1 Tax=Nadsonia fulvescens var. elongata DSM 6958 TaxID=857566 RepID=A0A1E3PNX8_9ASCO|nr:hypothetical protein NADFUDRAFT_81714 [Nadsonia fulvescens var. elongata DSM 6958]